MIRQNISLFMLIAGAAFAAPVLAIPPAQRALWVWNTNSIRHDSAAQNAFFAFLQKPHSKADRAISTLYFDGMAPRDFTDKSTVSELRRFLQESHRRNLKVHFLCGDSSWAKPENHEKGLANLRAIIGFNRGAKPGEKFDGFQWDVEPYTLKEWPSPILRQGYLEFLDKSKKMVHASGAALSIGAAIPRFFHNASTGFLNREVLKRVDYIALMDYVDSPERLVADAKADIEDAAKAGKSIWIGVETQKLPEEPMATFYAVGNEAMEKALAAAVSAYGGKKGFGGLAIHHWDSYRVFK